MLLPSLACKLQSHSSICIKLECLAIQIVSLISEHFFVVTVNAKETPVYSQLKNQYFHVVIALQVFLFCECNSLGKVLNQKFVSWSSFRKALAVSGISHRNSVGQKKSLFPVCRNFLTCKTWIQSNIVEKKKTNPTKTPNFP